ncbi:MAG: XRE family transcriptional regulator [Hymenobacter sp.]|nr:MAG: XRE family transcriptional regulator [Hymenobacter sp.]
MLGDRIKDALKNAGITYAKAASEMGISEGSLYNIFKKDSFEISYLLKISELVGLPPSYFLESSGSQPSTVQTGDFNQAGSGNSQKVKVDKGKPQQDLAAALAACQRELALANALVAAKDETITLLRASFTRPN